MTHSPSQATAAPLSWQDRWRSFKGRWRTAAFGFLEQFAYDVAGFPMTLSWGRPKLAPDARHAQALHDFYRKWFWARRGLMRGMVAAVCWPLALAFTIVQNTWRSGAAMRARSGKAPLKQATEQACFAWRYAIAPPWYYMFEVFNDNRAKAAGEYLTAHETIAGIYDALEPEAGRDQMADKVWFAEHCRAIGLKAVPVLGYVSQGTMHDLYSGDAAYADVDLFVKPRTGNGGHRAERWDALGNGNYRNRAGLVLNRKDVFAHLAERSLMEDYVIQPRLINHPALDDIANGALSTLRILTCLDETGSPVATNVAFRMAIGTNNVVDNFHQGGLASPVDLATGRLGPASDIGRYPDVGWRESHPVSGAVFVNRELPFWREAVNLAVEAAQAFPWRTAIGWDVALLKDGPMIVEGNGKPDLDIHQRCERRPLGRQRIAELLAYHAARYEI